MRKRADAELVREGGREEMEEMEEVVGERAANGAMMAACFCGLECCAGYSIFLDTYRPRCLMNAPREIWRVNTELGTGGKEEVKLGKYGEENRLMM